ncbi:hypothetical protein CLOM_g5689 [Closterium sp. NIES-68]|nr:hypothetical protein CLOM_g5689 [Closterium sp. NIES-68]GJP64044.1 hypothetical protein CLOP_g21077 [Closterium sp. NIES-67]
MSSIGAMAVRRFSSKPRVSVTDSDERESVIIMLPDGSIRLFDKSPDALEQLTAQTVLSEYPNMNLSSLEALVAPNASLAPGETYFLTPKRALSATRPPLTPPSRDGSHARSRGVLPNLPPRSHHGAASDGQIPLVRDGSFHRDCNDSESCHNRESHAGGPGALEIPTRASSPGCCSARSEESLDFSFVARECFGSGRHGSFGSGRRAGYENEEEEEAMDQPALYKSKTYSGSHNLRGSGRPQADFAKHHIELSPHRGDGRHSRTPSIVPSPTSSVSSVSTSQRDSHRLPPRPSPPPTPNPFLAEIAALDEEDCIANFAATVTTTGTSTRAPPFSSSPSEGLSIKAKVLATLAHFKPRNLRRKKIQSSAVTSDEADGVTAGVGFCESESAQDWADVDSRLFMTDTRIGHRQSRNRGGGAHPRGGYPQHLRDGVAWEAPSQVTLGDHTARDSGTHFARPGVTSNDAASSSYYRQFQMSPSPTADYGASFSSRICRSCNGMSSCCSCEAQPVAEYSVRRRGYASQGSSRQQSPATMQVRVCDFLDDGPRHRSNDYIMPPTNQRFLSGPIGPHASF